MAPATPRAPSRPASEDKSGHRTDPWRIGARGWGPRGGGARSQADLIPRSSSGPPQVEGRAVGGSQPSPSPRPGLAQRSPLLPAPWEPRVRFQSQAASTCQVSLKRVRLQPRWRDKPETVKGAATPPRSSDSLNPGFRARWPQPPPPAGPGVPGRGLLPHSGELCD